MPTIDGLPPAASVSDGDELVLSQNDIARKATRAQLLAGVQPELSIGSNTLLGRVSPGIGAPEVIAIGANLTLANGQISAPAAFDIGALPAGGPVVAADLLAISQGGQDAAVPVSGLFASFAATSGVDLSRMSASLPGVTILRQFQDRCGDFVHVEDFGAAGDGQQDDTAAFLAAAASGAPLHLRARTYVVNGAVDFSLTPALTGTPGESVILRRLAPGSGYWLQTDGSFRAFGVAFDAGALPGLDHPAFLVTAGSGSSSWEQCSFSNAPGVTSGDGLLLQTGASSNHVIRDCTFTTNTCCGLQVAGQGAVSVFSASAVANGGSGFAADAGASFSVRTSTSRGNGACGISAGQWTSGPAPSGTGSQILVCDNDVSGNGSWGIAISGIQCSIEDNRIDGSSASGQAGGILARLGASFIRENTVSGGWTGIDMRGSWGTIGAGNRVQNALTGYLAGGCQNVALRSNCSLLCSWGIVVSAIEPTLALQATGPVTIEGNWIGFSSAQGGGILLMDGVQNAAVVQNELNAWGSAQRSQALWLHTDAVIVEGNRFNNTCLPALQASQVAGLTTLMVPDGADNALVTGASGSIQSIITEHGADCLGQVMFVRVLNGGTGYTQATVTLRGTGQGASATALISQGRVIWIIVTNPGSGYGLTGTPVSVAITGDGSGATASAVSGLLPLYGRKLRLSCTTQLHILLAGAAPAQQSWTGFDFTVPPFGSADLEGAVSGWRVTSFPPVDYLSPTGDGGVIVQSQGNRNLVLRPGPGAALEFTSTAEPFGCTSSIGRGSPVGQISASPGSDYRNLNGGAGNTYWIKQQNSDASGWVALA